MTTLEDPGVQHLLSAKNHAVVSGAGEQRVKFLVDASLVRHQKQG